MTLTDKFSIFRRFGGQEKNHDPVAIQRACDRETARCDAIKAEYDALDRAFVDEAIIAGWSLPETHRQWGDWATLKALELEKSQ